MAINRTSLGTNSTLAQRSEVLLSIGFLGMLIVLLIPLPTVLLDMLLSANLGVTILLLLITITVTQPLDISAFPSMLLLMTLSRLSLNVATTRLILLDGDAGKIVSTFGGFVVGGNIIVGLVIFLILIVIQFIVITKGASRVSEVAARFTLDALPGKQMSIDAELNAGSLSETEAQEKRQKLSQETEFYGAMDGAGKFVRGDAIAGLVITGINLVGGILIGVTNGLSIVEAIARYSTLTIGDGLISQIPALIIATSAGILVTKATSDVSLGGEIGSQMLSRSRPLKMGAIIMAGVAFTPGLPKLPFVILAGVLMFVARKLESADSPVNSAEEEDQDEITPEGKDHREQHLDEFLQTDRARIEIGVRLIPLVNAKSGKGLAERVSNLRGELTKRHGIWVPSIRIRDSLQLKADEYRIMISGRQVATATLRPDSVLAINASDSDFDLEGIKTTDPAFGMPAIWIPSDMRQRAEMKGYTVVDATTVLITHLGEVLRRLAHELLSHEDLRKLVDRIRESSPTVVDEMKPELIRLGEVHQVLVALLKERVPLTNMTRILEVITQHAQSISDPIALADKVREQLGRDILDRFRGEDGHIGVMMIDPRMEIKFTESLRNGVLSLPHAELQRLVERINECLQKHAIDGREVTLLVDAGLRRTMRNLLERSFPDLAITSLSEVPSDMSIEVTNIVKLEDVYQVTNSSGQEDVRYRDEAGLMAVA